MISKETISLIILGLLVGIGWYFGRIISELSFPSWAEAIILINFWVFTFCVAILVLSNYLINRNRREKVCESSSYR